MPVPVYLPKFDPSHEQSEILNWLVEEGAHVREGDPLCEVETDKVNMEIEAPGDGVLARVLYPVGDVAPAAQVIAYLLAEGETEADLPAQQPMKAAPSTVNAAPAPVSISPVAQRIASAHHVDLQAVSGSGPRGKIMRRDLEPHLSAAATPMNKIRATPAAKRLAHEHGVDLKSVSGTGPRGRVQAADVTAAVPAPAADVVETYTLKGMRARIAERMQQSAQDAPHIFVEMPVNMDAVLAMRAQFKADGDNLSMTTILVKACARVLADHPRMNATFDGETVSVWRPVNIGVAVALDDGLVVPVLHDADSLPMREIQHHSTDLIGRARAGKLTPDDLTKGTFTISNLGMFGVSRFTALINPPQVAILAVGGIQRHYIPDEKDQPVIQSVMTLVLSVDHRLLDGADAARFLHDLRKMLEQPTRLAW